MSNGLGNYFYRSGAGSSSGSGSGFGAINYITNFGAETDTSTWILYTDSAKNIPQTGANGGGAATGLTFSRSTSSPLIGTGSFSMVQANTTSLQGKGVSYPFTIDSAFQATNLSIQLNYNASTTFVASDGVTAPLNDNTTSTNAGNSDIEVFIYDVTNAILIPVSPQVITGTGANNYQFKGTFQAASNSTSYRLIFHVASTSANATGWTFKFDNVFVGPQAQVSGAPMSDWVSFTPTGSWVSNSTYTGFYRRVGGDMEIQVNIALAGAPTATNLTINMPTGYTIDTTRLANSTLHLGTFLGSGGGKSAGTPVSLLIKYSTTTAVEVGFLASITTAAITLVDATHPATFASGDAITAWICVPVIGWGSNTVMSNDTDTRVVAVRAVGGTATVTGSYSDFTWSTVSNDSHGAFSGGLTFTVPVSGYYKFAGQIVFAGTGALNGTVNVSLFNTTTSTTLLESQDTYAGAVTASFACSFSFNDVLLTAGTALKIQVKSSATLPVISASNTLNFIGIERSSGPATIAATDTVAAAYTDTAGSVIGTSIAKYAYATKVFDTHSAYGNSGIYTVPISGKYLISAMLSTVSATLLTNGAFALAVFQSNAQKMNVFVPGNGAQTDFSTSLAGLLSCVSGETLSIQARFTTGTGTTAINAAGWNYFSINRIGN